MAAKREPEIDNAFDAWWRGLTRKGDPARMPNLPYDAFEAGYRIARATLVPGECLTPPRTDATETK